MTLRVTVLGLQAMGTGPQELGTLFKRSERQKGQNDPPSQQTSSLHRSGMGGQMSEGRDVLRPCIVLAVPLPHCLLGLSFATCNPLGLSLSHKM
jgi:hypothetical protein